MKSMVYVRKEIKLSIFHEIEVGIYKCETQTDFYKNTHIKILIDNFYESVRLGKHNKYKLVISNSQLVNVMYRLD